MIIGFIEMTETSEIPQSCITKHPDHFAEAVHCADVIRHSIKFFNEEFNSDYTSPDVTVPVIIQIPVTARSQTWCGTALQSQSGPHLTVSISVMLLLNTT